MNVSVCKCVYVGFVVRVNIADGLSAINFYMYAQVLRLSFERAFIPSQSSQQLQYSRVSSAYAQSSVRARVRLFSVTPVKP